MTGPAAPLRIALVHPALGLGGAERLMVNAALALQARGHRVRLHVAEHDPTRSFAATRDGRLAVRVCARPLPAELAGRLRLPLAVARLVAAARTALADGEALDALICDTVAQALPLLRRRTAAPILFYGHYPDALLTPPRRGWYRWYRLPLDRWEQLGLETADRLLVNSRFTAATFLERFPRLRRVPEVLHPPVETSRFGPGPAPPSASQTVAVVSRLVGSKNLALAIEAFAGLRARIPTAAFAPLRLVIAGGYDPRRPECVEAVATLTTRAAALGLGPQVAIVRSPDDAALQALLGGARALLYTPAAEHFGLVPIEAMAAGRPVIAVDRGGPTETVVDGVTGFLRPPTAAAFADALRVLVDEPATADRLGAAGRERVATHFSLEAFGERLETMVRAARPPRPVSAPLARGAATG
jgi:alpha-1,3/alpha-1,6-mannosyltransferase